MVGRESTSRSRLHDHFFAGPDNRVLHFFELVLHPVQSVDALLEVAREVGEQGRDLRVLEMLELRNDVIALFAGLHPVDQVLETLAAQAVLIDAFGEHACKEQRKIADVLAHLAFTIERGCWPVNRIGFQQHLAYIIERAIGSVSDFEELIGVTKFCEQMRDVADQLRITNADFFCIVSADEFNKQLLQWMRFRNHFLWAPRSPTTDFLTDARLISPGLLQTQVTFVSHSRNRSTLFGA